jgi:hypothetical protein
MAEGLIRIEAQNCEAVPRFMLAEMLLREERRRGQGW